MSWSDKKQAIFDVSVRLFAERGYNVVTVREIAAAIGINTSAIYFQFESKEAILNEIFDAFERKLKRYLLTKEQVDVYIETDTPRRLLERCLKDFYPDENEFMSSAYRITCMEMMTNPRARDLVVRRLHGETAGSIQYALDKLIERQKIPALDTRLFSSLWAQSMFSEAVTWLSGLSGDQESRVTSVKFHELGGYMIDMALSGKTCFDSV